GQDRDRHDREEPDVPPVRLAEILDPEKSLGKVAAASLRELANREEEREEDRHLRQHRQTAAGRVDAVRRVELQRLLGDLLAVLAVALLDLLDLRLELLHRHRRAY